MLATPPSQDMARVRLAEYGLEESEFDNGTVTAAIIADRIRSFTKLGEITELMENQCQDTLNSRLRLDDTFISQICGCSCESFQIIILSALHNRCPLMDSEGYACIASKQPVIYISDSLASEASLHLACSYLLLPSSRTIRVIPSTKRDDQDMFGAQSLDCNMLALAIEEDKQAGRMPLCIFATVPTTVFRRSTNELVYKYDNLVRMRQICDAQGIWLHVSGADLCFLSARERLDVLSIAVDAADSFTIRPRDLVNTGSDAHILMIRSAQFKEKLRKMAVYDVVAPVYLLLCSIGNVLEGYPDMHLSATRTIVEMSQRDYSDCFQLAVSQHSEIRPTFHVVPACLNSDELGLTLQVANSFILGDIQIHNLNTALVHDSAGIVQLTIRPQKYDELGEEFCTEDDIRAFLDLIKTRVTRLSRGVQVRPCLSSLISGKKPFVWSNKSSFSCDIGIGAFRLVPAFLTDDQHEAANCLNDCLAEQLFKHSPCFRGCYSDDNLVHVAILTIPNECPDELSDDEIAQYIFDIVIKIQVQIQYPHAVIELLSQSLQTGIEEAENYLIEMQNRNFNPLDVIKSVPIIGSVLGWLGLLNPPEDSEAKNPGGSFGQSFDLESKSLSRRPTYHDVSQSNVREHT